MPLDINIIKIIKTEVLFIQVKKEILINQTIMLIKAKQGKRIQLNLLV